MHKTEKVTGFMFTLSGGTTRHMKSIELWGSNGDDAFQLMKSVDAPDLESFYISLSETWSISKFKLVIKNSHSGEVHCRINEIDVTVSSNISGLDRIYSDAEFKKMISVFPNPVHSNLNFALNTEVENAKANILDISGKILFSSNIGRIQATEVIKLALPDLNSGIYMLQILNSNTIVGTQTIYIRN
jgi:hypothetical protein